MFTCQESRETAAGEASAPSDACRPSFFCPRRLSSATATAETAKPTAAFLANPFLLCCHSDRMLAMDYRGQAPGGAQAHAASCICGSDLHLYHGMVPAVTRTIASRGNPHENGSPNCSSKARSIGSQREEAEPEVRGARKLPQPTATAPQPA